MKPVRREIWWSVGLLVLVCVAFWMGRRSAPIRLGANPPSSLASTVADGDGIEPTRLYAHNLVLRKGPHFRVYARWIRGVMVRTRHDRNPSFDLPESFVLEIQKGVINVKLHDIADFLNNGTTTKMPLQNISIDTKDGQLQIHGTAHKIVPLPVRLDGTLTPLPDGRVKFHLTKLNVLKIPMKGLFRVFHIELSDLVKDAAAPGLQVSDNDILFDTQKLLPPPHIHGKISSVTLTDTEVKVVYGGVADDEQQLAKWHNFLRMVGGTLDFAKFTMHQADLTMIDATDDPWFDLDLTNYQTQLVYGTTRVTAKAGLELYMPDLDHLPAQKKAVEGVTVDWLKNRTTTPPLDVPGGKGTAQTNTPQG